MRFGPLSNTPVRFLLGGVVVVAVVATAWWIRSPGDEPLYGSFSAPSYESVEALMTDADVVVEGVVEGVAGRELDYGTANPEERFEGSGVPLVFYKVTVTATLKGDPDSSIIVGKIDAEKLITNQVAPLQPDDKVLLFLVEQIAAQDSPGITLFDFYYATLSLDAGVFDILPNGQFKPRDPDLVPPDGSVLERSNIES